MNNGSNNYIYSFDVNTAKQDNVEVIKQIRHTSPSLTSEHIKNKEKELTGILKKNTMKLLGLPMDTWLSNTNSKGKSSEIEMKTKTSEWVNKKGEKGFIENVGQMKDMDGNPVPFVFFKAEAPGMNIYITKKGITYLFFKKEKKEKKNEKGECLLADTEEENIKIEWERMDVELKGCSIKKENIIKENASITHFNFFYPHCSNGIYGVKEYKKIIIKEVYPGIDWVLYNSSEKGFKYDFIVHPGADYKNIQLIYKSKKRIAINAEGEIEVHTRSGNMKEQSPVSFYEGKELKTIFKQNYQKNISINGDNGFETSIAFYFPLVNFDLTTSNLIIDPQLTWATFYGGGNFDDPMSVDTDNSGNVFVTGRSQSTNFPVQNAGTFFQGINAGSYDAFILKFDNAGFLLWATYYGGTAWDEGNSIVTDNSGNVFVTGRTQSTDFPVQNAGTFFQGINAGNNDAFILKFDNLGNRLWATYYGGSGEDICMSITTDNSGNVFVTGRTQSTDFPVQNAGTFFQGINAGSYDAFILKFDNLGNRLWATYYGGSSNDDYGFSITTDNIGNVFVVGDTYSYNFPVQNAGTFFQGTSAGSLDVFILKFDNAGNRLWATYYGGSGVDRGFSIATDNSGNVFVTGGTSSTNFPVQNAGTFFQGSFGGSVDAYILKFDNAGNRLWATYYGGSGTDYSFSPTYDNIAIDSCGNVYLGFETNSNPFPYLQNSCDGQYFDYTYNGGSYDILLSLFNNSGNLLWCTYLGGDGSDYGAPLTVDTNNSLFVGGDCTGVTNNATYPVTNPGGGAYYDPTFNGGNDGFIAKFCSAPCLCSPYNGCIICTPPSVTITATGSLNCTTNTVQITTTVTPSSGITYNWSGPGIVSGSSTGTIIVNQGGTYNVTVTTSNGCTATTSQAITQNTTAPFVTTFASGTLNCTTNTVQVTTTVTPSSGIIYNWSGPGIVSGLGTGTITVNQGGTYNVTVTNTANNCTATTSQAITQNTTAPTISAAPSGSLNCTTNIVQITTTVTPSSGITYNWSGSGIVSGAGTGTITVNQGGTYNVTVTNTANNCTATTSQAITQNTTPPNVSSAASGSIDCATNTVQITTTVTPSSGITYNWSGPGIVSGSGTGTITVNQGGTYNLTVTNTANNCTATTSQSIIQNTTPPNISTAASGSIDCATNTVQITTTVSPTSGITYNWNGPGIVSGAGTGTITVNQPGTYQVTVTNTANNCTATTSQAITQNTTAPTILSAASGSLNCTTNTVQITTTVTPSSGITYNWSGPGIVSGASTGTITVNQSGTYNLTVTNTANNCTATTSQAITQNTTPPNISISASDSIDCATNTVQITTTVSPSSGITYNWNGPGIVSGSGTGTIVVNQGGVYNLTVTNTANNCTATTSQAITQNTTPPNISSAASGSIDCATNTVQITTTVSPTSGITYNWIGPGIVSGSGTGTITVNQGGAYNLTVTNTSNGCSATTTQTVIQNTTAPVVTASASGSLTCVTNTVQITTTVTPSSGITYNWSGPGILNGSGTGTIIVNQSGIYNLTVTNTANNCTTTASQAVTQNTTAPVITASALPGTVCLGQTTTLTASGADTYLWSNGISTMTGSMVTENPTSDVTYTVVGTDLNNGCKDTSYVSITVKPLPIVTAVASSTVIYRGESVTLTGTGTATVYLWSDGVVDGVAFVPEVTNTYTVTGIDANGCSNIDTITVLVKELKVQVFSYISPNGDGKNDQFLIETIEKYPNNVVQIYNRWGQLIVEIKNYDNQENAWGSKKYPINEPGGTYYYVIDLDGKGKNIMKGFMEIIK
jgi:gliding motility-associated-like protein